LQTNKLWDLRVHDGRVGLRFAGDDPSNDATVGVGLQLSYNSHRITIVWSKLVKYGVIEKRIHQNLDCVVGKEMRSVQARNHNYRPLETQTT
jgi:hypothetical protein